MRFNNHSEQASRHAFLSPSSHSWSNYTDEKLEQRFSSHLAHIKGTQLHALAHDLIKHRINLPETTATLNMYVNDAVGFRMEPEVVLMYSNNCFGTADALNFRDNFLRVHDLKTGVLETSIRQLEIYEALFCLEYKYNPFKIGCELRIYQNDQIRRYEPDPDDIFHLMEKIVHFDKILNDLRAEER